jgi:predicted ferric reductase
MASSHRTISSFTNRSRISVSNLALLTFLALKNTPLAILTSYSYERLHILHRAAGYTTVFFSLLHATIYIISLAKSNDLVDLLETSQIMGITGGFAVLVSLASTFLLRQRRYEVFYAIHVTMFILILIVLGMHRPELAKKTLIIIIFTASIWISDRLFRASRLAYNAWGNEATITPLPHGGVRILVKHSPARAVAGSHIFLWVPAIRALETHPFTVVSTNPLELVIKAHDGFTKDLLKHATSNSGANLRASVDGPYGTFPDFMSFDHVVLIAGGIGASFTFGVALEMLRKFEISQAQSRMPKVTFVWVVKEKGMPRSPSVW